jgi:hypothetical protein
VAGLDREGIGDKLCVPARRRWGRARPCGQRWGRAHPRGRPPRRGYAPARRRLGRAGESLWSVEALRYVETPGKKKGSFFLSWHVRHICLRDNAKSRVVLSVFRDLRSTVNLLQGGAAWICSSEFVFSEIELYQTRPKYFAFLAGVQHILWGFKRIWHQ